MKNGKQEAPALKSNQPTDTNEETVPDGVFAPSSCFFTRIYDAGTFLLRTRL